MCTTEVEQEIKIGEAQRHTMSLQSAKNSFQRQTPSTSLRYAQRDDESLESAEKLTDSQLNLYTALSQK